MRSWRVCWTFIVDGRSKAESAEPSQNGPKREKSPIKDPRSGLGNLSPWSRLAGRPVPSLAFLQSLFSTTNTADQDLPPALRRLSARPQNDHRPSLSPASSRPRLARGVIMGLSSLQVLAQGAPVVVETLFNREYTSLSLWMSGWLLEGRGGKGGVRIGRQRGLNTKRADGACPSRCSLASFDHNARLLQPQENRQVSIPFCF